MAQDSGRRQTRGKATRLVGCAGAVAMLVAGAGRAVEAQPPPADQASVQAAAERGAEAHTVHCGFCHGISARGGASGPDLVRSELVLDDVNGQQLGEFLRVGRPEAGMPAFDLPEGQVTDIAAFLHAEIDAAANRRGYEILDIVTGDPAAGREYFNGAGGCSRCHSPTGDLEGIGSRYDPVALQGRLIMPPRGARGGGPGPVDPAERDRNRVRVTVTLPSGESHTGVMVRLTDFDVSLRDESGRTRSWLRSGDSPTVVLTDPLQPHLDMLPTWQDTDMRNMTAYLLTLE
jgi:cytochrome c oxidase cbb3-type subunit 3